MIRSTEPNSESVLILTPIKDAARHFSAYVEQLDRLSFPRERLSLGLLEGDSTDATYSVAQRALEKLRSRFRRVGIWKRDFGFHIPSGTPRWETSIQVQRRGVLARSRNHLLFRALDDEDWVLWLDSDVSEYPADIIERLLAVRKPIVQPHCVFDYGGTSFDRNAWRDHGRLYMHDLRKEGDLVPLDSVGGTMLLVHADVHRDGLIFPAFPYGLANARVRSNNHWQGEIETEGLGMMAADMGVQCWGLPNLEIRHAHW